MAPNKITKQQVLLSLSMLNPALQKIAEVCIPIGAKTNRPEVFSVVAKHLPSLVEAFSSIQKYLDSTTEETASDEISEKYPVIGQAARQCCDRISDLQELFEAVGNSRNKTEDYRNAVECGKGQPLETMMLEMLQGASSAATLPLVAEEQIAALNEALEEIGELDASLGDEPASARVTLHNHGAGSQFYHGGRGNMNHCSGGQQITGENHGATYNHGPMGNKQN
ncbi:hypothetical protein CEP54_012309 [Fusarium duplospermum]|uniref:NACHT-NTPase and P-loop NTPases N-terminal domain-containing protein n=1 Tax=Fusarium duplospermum TaxID=1325734 RepID=A0A428P9K1_9HYPO|nr:hypothetical protein CEP54_012309 [Fusarium duplospermum]